MDKDEAVVIVERYLEKVRAAGFIILAAYVFGSTARGSADKDSDIDVALVIENLSDSFDAQVQLMKIRREVDLRIEPHPFAAREDPTATLLYGEVLKTGIKVA